MNVTCKFKSNTTTSSIALDGRCTSLAVFSRAITADLKTNGSAYSGSYVGAGTGAAGLNGTRVGDAIKLDVKWAKAVNGDRRALLTIEKIGSSGMRLTTVDADPATGRSIVTSQIWIPCNKWARNEGRVVRIVQTCTPRLLGSPDALCTRCSWRVPLSSSMTARTTFSAASKVPS